MRDKISFDKFEKLIYYQFQSNLISRLHNPEKKEGVL